VKLYIKIDGLYQNRVIIPLKEIFNKINRIKGKLNMLIDEMIKYHIAVIVLLLGISIYGFFYLLGKEIDRVKIEKKAYNSSYIFKVF